MSDYKIPTWLKHKPVIVIENYHNVGGYDAKGLSLGLAQWNDRGNVDISAKIWRHTDNKWSRQSEEMPLKRVLDLAILICKSYLHLENSNEIEKNNFAFEDILVYGNNELKIQICEDDIERVRSDFRLFIEKWNENEKETLKERILFLSEILNEIKVGRD